jgi:hypothetical protein
VLLLLLLLLLVLVLLLLLLQQQLLLLQLLLQIRVRRCAVVLCAELGLAPSERVCRIMADKTTSVIVPLVLSVVTPARRKI